MAFTDEINDYITDSDTAAQTAALTAGAKWLINLIPQERLERWVKELTIDASAGIAVTGSRLFRNPDGSFRARISSNLKGARTINAYLAARAADSNSLHFANAGDPVVYLLNQTVFIKPALAGKIDGIAYPTVLYSESTIADFPGEYTRGVVLYATIQRAISKVNDAILALDALSLSSVTEPSLPPPPSYTYTEASLGIYITTSISSFGIPPVFTPPVTDFTLANLATHLDTNKDIELSQTEIQRQRSKLELFSQDIQNALAEFNEQVEEFRSDVQKKIEQARLDQQALLQAASDTTNLNLANEAKELERQVAEYSGLLQAFNIDLGLYAQNINKAVSEYSQNIQRDTQVIGSFLNLVVTLRNELNEFLKGL